jgi:hypothetical protein
MVLTLFSAIAVTGSGLHYLPGVGHDHDCLAKPLLPTGSGASSLATTAGDEHCPICQYFTQAQTVPLLIAFEIDFPVVDGRISPVHSFLSDHATTAYSSRAPPSCG